MKRTSPPVGVQARPVATPGSLVRRRCSAKTRRRPSSSRALLAETLTLPLALPSATSRATLRQTVPIWRSRLRTPASRVYSSMIAVSAASANSICDGFSPLASIWRADQVAAGDVALLLERVAGQFDRLHPVQQRPRDRVEHVGGGDEDDVGEVELEVEVVVAEGVVLGRVEHLEHRRGGVAAEVGAHLVDLVDHEDGVAGAGVAQGADDRPRQGADVGAAVAADLGLVADAADRDPLELAAQRLGDRAAEAGLADPGRADEAEDRAGRVGVELAHRQVLEDPVLDLLEVVVVGVEDLAGVGDVEVVLGLLRPGQLDQPLEVGADDAVLGRGRAAVSPAARARARRLCSACSGSSAASIFSRSSLTSACCSSPSPSSSWIAFSCWRRKNSRWPLSISDCDLGLDLGAELDHLELAGEDLREVAQPLGDVDLFQQLLLLLGARSAGRRRSGGRAPPGRRCWRPPSAAPPAGRGSARRSPRRCAGRCGSAPPARGSARSTSGSSAIRATR